MLEKLRSAILLKAAKNGHWGLGWKERESEIKRKISKEGREKRITLKGGHWEKQNIKLGKNKFYRNYKGKGPLNVVYEKQNIYIEETEEKFILTLKKIFFD